MNSQASTQTIVEVHAAPAKRGALPSRRVVRWRARQASVAIKVAIAPLTAIACLLLVGLIGIWCSRDLLASMREMRAQTLPSLSAMNSLQRRLGAVVAATNQSLAWTGAEFPTDRIAALDKATTAELQAIGRQIGEEAARTIYDAEVRKRLQVLASSYNSFQLTALDLLDMKKDGLTLAGTFMQQLGDAYQVVDAQITSLSAALRTASEDQVDHAALSAASKMTAIAVTFIVALALSLFVAWWSARLIVRPLREAKRLASEIAAGNIALRQLSSGEDETGQVVSALVEVAGNLNHMVGDIRTAALQIDSASCEIANGNADLSARTEHVASELQMATASVDHLAGMVRASADKAREVDDMARSASDVAREGGVIVAEVVVTMQGVNAQSRQIAEIVGTIDSIAFQTNILALNAAVEAARAGEQGRGFAVVAAEVRSLAQRSAAAAREIKMLIDDSVRRIGHGARQAQDAGQTMSRVVGAVAGVAATIGEISAAATQQAGEIEQFSRAIATMEQSTQQNAALVEQASAATLMLRQQAEQLVASIQRFQVE
jgi:methyl-accepting chemotaxis protein